MDHIVIIKKTSGKIFGVFHWIKRDGGFTSISTSSARRPIYLMEEPVLQSLTFLTLTFKWSLIMIQRSYDKYTSGIIPIFSSSVWSKVSVCPIQTDDGCHGDWVKRYCCLHRRYDWYKFKFRISMGYLTEFRNMDFVCEITNVNLFEH